MDQNQPKPQAKAITKQENLGPEIQAIFYLNQSSFVCVFKS